ncbi:hypothetical protein NDU88_005832 [Pleurodeles waltl]|uniref:Uncharacterized protein n=1 Tax=Pleurodeles waltl TaxID=8319 RepID=A0AAV7SMT2_PLEWA|nr:hypothetical protein NDU88_005832 [Pleurodeles waltl]
MAGPVITRARLQAPTGPPTPVSPRRGGAASSRGVAAPLHPANSLSGPGSRHRRARGPLRSTASGASSALLEKRLGFPQELQGPKWLARSSPGPDFRPPSGLQLRSHLAVGAQLPPGASPHPFTQPTAYRAQARGTEEPAAPCAPQPLAPARHSWVRAPRAQQPRTPRGRREPQMSPGSQASRRGTSGRPVPHPGSKFQA